MARNRNRVPAWMGQGANCASRLTSYGKNVMLSNCSGEQCGPAGIERLSRRFKKNERGCNLVIDTNSSMWHNLNMESTLEQVMEMEAARKAAKPLAIGTRVMRYGFTRPEFGLGVVVAAGHLPGTVVVEHKAIFANLGPTYPQTSRTLCNVVDLTVVE